MKAEELGEVGRGRGVEWVEDFAETMRMWQGVVGHDAIAAHFKQAVGRERLAGSFLFVGPVGVGKRTFALALAKTLLCSSPSAVWEACGVCPSCQLVGTTPTHPDLITVSKPPDKTALPLELLVGDRDHRGHSGFLYNIAHTAVFGGKKVAIIDDADTLQEEAANALLKTLEEPPPDTLIILLGTSPAKQLPTIRSRCRIVRFAPIPSPELATLLVTHRIVATSDEARALAERSSGSIARAIAISDPTLEHERREIVALARPPVAPVAAASRLLECVERVGKEATLRRQRLRYFLEEVCDDEVNRLRAGTTVGTRTGHATERLDRTLEAIEQIDRNATPAYIIEAWAVEIART